MVDDQNADAIPISKLLQLADYLIIAGVAVTIAHCLPDFLQGIYNNESGVTVFPDELFQLFIQATADHLSVGGAWQTFGGKSSTKNTHGLENQLMLDFESKGVVKTHTDEFCFYIKDIAEYLQKSFNGQSDVPMSDVWALLDNHPIFPSDGFRSQIKNELKQNHGASVSRSTISFVDRS